MKEVYITRTANYLPNDPVSNDEMESYLGLINQLPSKTRNLILRNNGIKTRYYALTQEGKQTHTNDGMAAAAVRNLFAKNPGEISEVGLLCAGTSSPDQLMPSHGVMVHGSLPETGNIEVISPAGNCCSGMHALKYAWLSLRSGEKENAVCVASELLSLNLAANQFEEEAQALSELEQNPMIAFEKDFLRWMLSDGAGAFLLETDPDRDNISLRIDWVEAGSFAFAEETCMYMAAEKLPDGTLRSYKTYTPRELMSRSVLSMKQDVKLLGEKIVQLGFETLSAILERRNENVENVDYLLPHLSSYYFEDKIANVLRENGTPIPKDKWFTNLRTVGNVGAASIYLMVDELFRSGKLKKGQKILLAVPESARFSYVFSMLTVV